MVVAAAAVAWLPQRRIQRQPAATQRKAGRSLHNVVVHHGNEQLLFHGCAAEAEESIMTSGFKKSYWRSSTGRQAHTLSRVASWGGASGLSISTGQSDLDGITGQWQRFGPGFYFALQVRSWWRLMHSPPPSNPLAGSAWHVLVHAYSDLTVRPAPPGRGSVLPGLQVSHLPAGHDASTRPRGAQAADDPV